MFDIFVKFKKNSAALTTAHAPKSRKFLQTDATDTSDVVIVNTTESTVQQLACRMGNLDAQ
jgi:hypothetical protein